MTRFFDKCREARATLTASETVATLDYMEDFYGNGANWTKGVYTAANGARCLVGAADHARVSAVDDAKYWLRQAIAEREPHWTIEQFNDNCEDFSEIVAVIRRAKELALAAQSSAVRPAARAALPSAPVVEVLPPNAPAWLPAPRPARTASVPQVPLARPAPVMIDVTPRPEPQRVRAPAPASANRRRASLFWELLGE